MIPHEDLSRLLSGELPDAEARTLRARIDDEPDVAAAWARLQQLAADLGELSDEAPPARLDAEVLAERPRVERTAARPMGWLAGAALALAVAAVALLWIGSGRPSTVHIVAGDQLVDGAVAVLAGDQRIEIDGLARIIVEPDHTLARAWAANPEDPMNRTTALTAAAAAAVGAAVTVVVYEGRATLLDAEASAVVVDAGQTHRVPGAHPAGARRVVIPPAAPVPPGATEAERIALLKDRVAELEQALSQSEFTEAIAQGQLVAAVGEPQPWPDDVHDGLAPEALEAAIQAALAEVGEQATLAELDCSEYPCIAVLEPTEMSDDWEKRLQGVPEAVAEGIEGDMALSVMAAQFDDGEGEGGLMGFVISPPEHSGRDSDVGARTSYRATSLLEEMSRGRLGEGSED